MLTIKAVAFVTILSVCIAGFLAWRANRQIPGLRLFAVGLLSLSLGGVLGFSRLWIPGPAPLIVCNVFIFGGVVLMMQGIRVFRGFRPMHPIQLFVIVWFTAGLFFYWTEQNNLGMRVAAMSWALSLITADGSASMFRKVAKEDRGIYWPTGFALAFASSYYAVRAIGGIFGAYGPSIFSFVPLEVAITVCTNIALIGTVFGMLHATTAQVRRDAQKLALFDPLTNLPNRRYFHERLSAIERYAIASGNRFGLIYFNLEGLKEINERLGHAAGDDLLRRVASSLSRAVRESDCLARLEGNEFAVIAASVANRSDVLVVADRLKRAIDEHTIHHESTLGVQATCGAALFPDDGRTAETVMRVADGEMYREKNRAHSSAKVALAV